MSQTSDIVAALMLPRYQCHKQVRAGKIIDVSLSAACVTLHLELPGAAIAIVNVSHKYYVHYHPQLGGYFVQYENGHQSYSPAAAFEGGYTLIENAA